jgi:hypothetical protein
LNKNLLITLTLGSLLLVAGCGSKDTDGSYVAQKPKEVPKFNLPAGEEFTMFPFDLGNEWVYTVDAEARTPQGQTGKGADEFTFRVVSVEPTATNDGKKVVLRVYRKDTPTEASDEQTYQIDKTGIQQLTMGIGANKMEFDPPQTVIKFPVKIGDKYTWEGMGPVGGKLKKSKLEVEVVGTQLVDTQSDEHFDALQIKQIQTWMGDNNREGRQESDIYWFPKVGLVRLFQQVTNDQGGVGATKLQLKKKTLKGDGKSIPTAKESLPEADAAPSADAAKPIPSDKPADAKPADKPADKATTGGDGAKTTGQ